jgi:hypothetical protein
MRIPDIPTSPDAGPPPATPEAIRAKLRALIAALDDAAVVALFRFVAWFRGPVV